ncbi:ribbon-helix-helix domain-containing protein [Methylobacterium flocculans]|uniref:ribbon-helix-helix domain-containing protein n=1 Tax=Methylobacterium flocculans TaxID=2984843 RepID=UPI0021F2EC9D|nr:ribbon-helix-helix domain-containing protein [Methylobacterium sp. FF17]
MPKPPKLSLASIVAAAVPPGKPQQTAEIVQLGTAGPPPRRGNATLKERARQMSVYLEPPVYDQLRDLAHAERAKMHGLMLEALDLLFKQRGARSIDQLNEPDGR